MSGLSSNVVSALRDWQTGGFLGSELAGDAADEIDRLTKREAELVAIIGRAASAFGAPFPFAEAGQAAQAAWATSRAESLNEMLAALKEQP